MYKSPFYLKVFYSSVIIIIGIIYWIYTRNYLYFIISIFIILWFIYYLKNLAYYIKKDRLIKKSGRFFKITKVLKTSKIISVSHYNIRIIKINILIIKHLEGRMLITFLDEFDIKDIIKKI